jgi:hypothetical protein
MSRLMWIEVEHPEHASRLAEMLELNGVHADVRRTLRGKPEVRIQKPRLRRMNKFIVDVKSVVRKWLEEQAPEVRRVIAETADERFEIQSPIAHAIGRTRNADAA